MCSSCWGLPTCRRVDQFLVMLPVNSPRQLCRGQYHTEQLLGSQWRSAGISIVGSTLGVHLPQEKRYFYRFLIIWWVPPLKMWSWDGWRDMEGPSFLGPKWLSNESLEAGWADSREKITCTQGILSSWGLPAIHALKGEDYGWMWV